jgi:2-iminobutanoate/2-iminopropanoate deaminase
MQKYKNELMTFRLMTELRRYFSPSFGRRPYVSHATIVGDLVFVCGMGPNDLDADVETQTEQTIMNIKTILEEVGSSLSKVVKVVVYLKDVSDYERMNNVYSKYFTDNPPARTCVQATSPLHYLGQRVEMDVIAVIDRGTREKEVKT